MISPSVFELYSRTKSRVFIKSYETLVIIHKENTRAKFRLRTKIHASKPIIICSMKIMRAQQDMLKCSRNMENTEKSK